MEELKTVNCEQLMTTPLKPIEFCIDGMISVGLFILAGAPKIGKSWLALDMDFWGMIFMQVKGTGSSQSQRTGKARRRGKIKHFEKESEYEKN